MDGWFEARETADHPRSRGVYGPKFPVAQRQSGSSPLARGLHRVAIGYLSQSGIIPARAGFTPWLPVAVRPPGDHPRSRGVYGGVYPGTRFRVGSSPLARGLLAERGDGGLRHRIIPARAGFTLREAAGLRRAPDHPRSRGVYGRVSTTASASGGSSPLARGLHHAGGAKSAGGGIIPARAGFTGAAGTPPWRGPDHPRSRGVYAYGSYEEYGVRGSSPLARGLPPRAGGRHGPRRIIPARAGFTLADPWNPNDEPHYQTAFAFTADLALAPQSSDSVVVSQRSTRTPSEA